MRCGLCVSSSALEVAFFSIVVRCGVVLLLVSGTGSGGGGEEGEGKVKTTCDTTSTAETFVALCNYPTGQHRMASFLVNVYAFDECDVCVRPPSSVVLNGHYTVPGNVGTFFLCVYFGRDPWVSFQGWLFPGYLWKHLLLRVLAVALVRLLTVILSLLFYLEECLGQCITSGSSR